MYNQSRNVSLKKKEKQISNYIAFFMPSLAGGGAERVVLILVKAFVERGFKVDLVLTRAQGAYINDVPYGVRVVDLNASRITASLPGLIKYLNKEQPPVILSALKSTNCIAVLARAFSRSKAWLILSEHTTVSQTSLHAKDRRAKILPKLMKLTYPFADNIIAVSKGVAEDLASVIGLDNNKIKVIYNPVVTSKLFKMAKEHLDHPWFKAGEPPVILGVGRLIPAKDFITLIRAFAHLRHYQDARLIILGEGEERKKLEKLVYYLGIEQDVSLPGFVENPYKYMAKASLFVLSSRWEGLPIALIEALACGCPVVSTDCPSGPAEILENGKYGELLPVGDEEAIADAILRTLENPMDSNLLKSRANDFSSKDIANQYLNCLFYDN